MILDSDIPSLIVFTVVRQRREIF